MKKILVIEDTPAMRDLIVDTLSTQEEYECFSAQDGIEGVEAARKNQPDLIICDIHMPRMDGYGVLEAVRKEGALATVPFVFLTGATERINMRRGMELGADDYLTKPFAIQELIASVSAQLEKKDTIQRQTELRLEELRGNITLALPHELRTPLNGILGLSSMLIEDYELLTPEDTRENLRFIHQSATRLHRLIENFLVYSQILLLEADAGQDGRLTLSESNAVETSLKTWAEEFAEKYRRSDDLSLELQAVSVRVPPDNFKKIATELIDNAFKFSKPGDRVEVATELSNGFLKLRIHDTGRGMSADQLERIGAHMQFDRKFHEQQGAGLGLVIARRLAEMYGGSFEIRSTPKQGTEIVVQLPA